MSGTNAGVTYTPATVTSIDVETGYWYGTTTVTITGTGFDVHPIDRVEIRSVVVEEGPEPIDLPTYDATDVTYVGATSTTFVTAEGGGVFAPEAMDVIVYPIYGPAMILSEAFTYMPLAVPILSSTAPQSGIEAGGTAVTLTGLDFDAEAITNVVFTDADGVPHNATLVVVVGPTSITCVSPAGVAAGAEQPTVTIEFALTTTDPQNWTYT